MTTTRQFKAQVDPVEDGEAGEFEALVSVFDNTDSYGDVVRPGAFAKSLAGWAESGDSIPVVWAHRWDDPFSHVGWVKSAEETARGLVVRGVIDDTDNPTAKQVRALLRGRRIKQFSFAYDVLDSGPAKVDGKDVTELRELSILEVGPCFLGVNRDTELLAAKADEFLAGTKAGRVLSQKNFETLRDAYESIGAVLAAAEPDGKADGPPSSATTVMPGEQPAEQAEPVTDLPEGQSSGEPGDNPSPEQSQESSQVEEPPTDEEPEGAKSDRAAATSPLRLVTDMHLWMLTDKEKTQ